MLLAIKRVSPSLYLPNNHSVCHRFASNLTSFPVRCTKMTAVIKKCEGVIRCAQAAFANDAFFDLPQSQFSDVPQNCQCLIQAKRSLEAKGLKIICLSEGNVNQLSIEGKKAFFSHDGVKRQYIKCVHEI